MGFLRAEQNLWLDNLYIRFITSNRTQQSPLVDCFGLACNLWLTSVTIHGENSVFTPEDDDEMGAVAVVGGQLYAKGVCFMFQHPAVRFFKLEISNEFMRICETMCVA
jgi:hypothetical protein